MKLENKVAIVTGGARGIGLAISQAMAKEGARVVVMDPGGTKDGRPGEATHAEEAAAQIRAAGGQAIGVAESVADHAACKRAVDAAVAAFGTSTFWSIMPACCDPRCCGTCPRKTGTSWSACTSRANTT